jgi:hypothetical protein
MRLDNLIDANRLGAFSFFVVIASATGVGLFAFLAQLSSHLSNFLSSKVRPIGCVHPHTTQYSYPRQYSYPSMVRTDHLPVCALGNVVLGCLCSDPIIGLPYADVQKRPFVKAAVRLECGVAAETLCHCAKYPLRWFPNFTNKQSRICGDRRINSE